VKISRLGSRKEFYELIATVDSSAAVDVSALIGAVKVVLERMRMEPCNWRCNGVNLQGKCTACASTQRTGDKCVEFVSSSYFEDNLNLE
jgi:hypothetical protein